MFNGSQVVWTTVYQEGWGCCRVRGSFVFSSFPSPLCYVLPCFWTSHKQNSKYNSGVSPFVPQGNVVHLITYTLNEFRLHWHQKVLAHLPILALKQQFPQILKIVPKMSKIHEIFTCSIFYIWGNLGSFRVFQGLWWSIEVSKILSKLFRTFKSLLCLSKKK